VVVRTIGTVFYLVGDAPDGWAPGTTYWPWPPSAPERQQIDLDFEAACEAAAEDEAAWAAYEAARDAWLADRGHSSGQGAVVHECSIALPESAEVMWFEEFDAAGELCGARSREAGFVFGSAVEVLSSATGRFPDDGWVRAVVAALERERSWSDNRRSSLEVYPGSGEMFHVSAAANRDSIGHHGLDWRLMQRPGVAGSRFPELEALFLCESESDVQFFTDMARVPSDVWAVDVTGRWIENGPSGWAIVSEPIPPSAVRVVRRDVLSRLR
jgi:hypothetical protein